MLPQHIVPAAAAALILAGGAFAQSAKVTGGSQRSVRDVQQDVVDGKKPRVAVRQFENRSGVRCFHNGKAVGEGMKEMLESALGETGQFLVFERERLDLVLEEQDFGQNDRFRRAGAPRLGELETLDFLVTGTITELMESQAGGGGRGALSRGGRKNLKKLGLDMLELGGSKSQDHVAIDLKLIDVRSGQIVATATVEGKAEDFSIDGALGARLGKIGQLLLSGGGESRTPIQKAVRACIVQAVDWVAQRIVDEGFYRADQSPWEGTAPTSAPDRTKRADSPSSPPALASDPTPISPRSRQTIDAPIAIVAAEPRTDARVLALVGFGQALTPDAAEPRIGEWVPVILADGRRGWVEGRALRE